MCLIYLKNCIIEITAVSQLKTYIYMTITHYTNIRGTEILLISIHTVYIFTYSIRSIIPILLNPNLAHTSFSSISHPHSTHIHSMYLFNIYVNNIFTEYPKLNYNCYPTYATCYLQLTYCILLHLLFKLLSSKQIIKSFPLHAPSIWHKLPYSRNSLRDPDPGSGIP